MRLNVHSQRKFYLATVGLAAAFQLRIPANDLRHVFRSGTVLVRTPGDHVRPSAAVLSADFVAGDGLSVLVKERAIHA